MLFGVCGSQTPSASIWSSGVVGNRLDTDFSILSRGHPRGDDPKDAASTHQGRIRRGAERPPSSYAGLNCLGTMLGCGSLGVHLLRRKRRCTGVNAEDGKGDERQASSRAPVDQTVTRHKRESTACDVSAFRSSAAVA